MKQIKTAEEILKENYLHPLSKTEKYWIVKSMQTYTQQLKPEWTAVEDGLPEVKGKYLAVLEYAIQGVTHFKIDIEEYIGGGDLWQQHAFNKIMPHKGFDKMPTVILWQPLPSLPNPKQ